MNFECKALNLKVAASAKSERIHTLRLKWFKGAKASKHVSNFEPETPSNRIIITRTRIGLSSILPIWPLQKQSKNESNSTRHMNKGKAMGVVKQKQEKNIRNRFMPINNMSH